MSSQLSAAALAHGLLEWTEQERANIVNKLRGEGYELVDELDTGEYTLALWHGTKEKDHQPVRFYEMSLNMKGYDFTDEHAQSARPPAGHPPRNQMLQRVGQWLERVGTLYVGSFDDRKLRFYYGMFKRYFPGVKVSAPFPAFDDSVKADYFMVRK